MISESVLLVYGAMTSLETRLESESSQEMSQDSRLLQKRKHGLQKYVLRNVRVTVPEVVGVQVKVDDMPAVTVKPGRVVGGFDVDPVCAATTANKHATIKSGENLILNVATKYFVYTRDATR